MGLKKIIRVLCLFTILVGWTVIFSCQKQENNIDVKPSQRIVKEKKTIEPKDTLVVKHADSTENVIVLIIDGARYADTWDATGTPLIPYRTALRNEGFFCSNFRNNGLTLTVSGHTAIMTGNYETMNNTGTQTPSYPSMMQVWRKSFNKPAEKAWIVASKDKLEVIKNCTNGEWNNVSNPMTNCGNNGLGSGYRDDLTTLNKAKTILSEYEPNLMLINFKQPDFAGHSADSLAYVQGIFDTDNYVNLIWNFIQTNEHYKNKTALIVTNDHGRHTPGHLDGFISHGDDCEGCRHIEFLALGPDFKKNYITGTSYEQIDIAPTIAYLLGFKMPYGKGKVMKELLKN
jgi:hypothetical protein